MLGVSSTTVTNTCCSFFLRSTFLRFHLNCFVLFYPSLVCLFASPLQAFRFNLFQTSGPWLETARLFCYSLRLITVLKSFFIISIVSVDSFSVMAAPSVSQVPQLVKVFIDSPGSFTVQKFFLFHAKQNDLIAFSNVRHDKGCCNRTNFRNKTYSVVERRKLKQLNQSFLKQTIFFPLRKVFSSDRCVCASICKTQKQITKS